MINNHFATSRSSLDNHSRLS